MLDINSHRQGGGVGSEPVNIGGRGVFPELEDLCAGRFV
jgi:hypothetical protein